MTSTRRSLLRGAVALACLPACGALPREVDAGTPDAGPEPLCGATRGGVPGWVEVKLDEHPALAAVWGAEAVQIPSALLDVVVARVAAECFVAVWRDCTHGACHVEYDASARWLECPCHGSRFGEDGAVLRGPATRALRSFPVVREGDSLWIYRPLG
jgi:cytochrome b6-f complex iron-sulfur subunit